MQRSGFRDLSKSHKQEAQNPLALSQSELSVTTPLTYSFTQDNPNDQFTEAGNSALVHRCFYMVRCSQPEVLLYFNPNQECSGKAAVKSNLPISYLNLASL